MEGNQPDKQTSAGSTEAAAVETSPRNTVIEMGPPATFNLTCYGFHVWAEDFLAAEKLYAPTARSGSFVPQFLCCQSIELSLKAFLSLKGLTRTKLRRKFGHNLAKLYDEGLAMGIGAYVVLQPDDPEIVARANSACDSRGGKKLQYFDVWDALTAFKNLPELPGLEDLASRLQAPGLRELLLAG